MLHIGVLYRGRVLHRGWCTAQGQGLLYMGQGVLNREQGCCTKGRVCCTRGRVCFTGGGQSVLHREQSAVQEVLCASQR